MSTNHRFRMTTQRKVILEELKKLNTHPTAGVLCGIVRKRLPRISLGTVYRNLDILSRQGVIQKLDVGGNEMRFDGDISNHYHLRCLDCGKVDDLEVEQMPGLDEDMAAMSGYEIKGHRLEFVGHCPGCRSAQFPLSIFDDTVEPLRNNANECYQDERNQRWR